MPTRPARKWHRISLGELYRFKAVVIRNYLIPTNMVLTLYKVDASPPVRAVLMTLEVLGIKNVEMVETNVFVGDHLKGDFEKINPQHTVPTLKDGDLVVWDSHAIITYLVNKYAKNHPLYPTDPKKRALIDQRLHFDSGILFSTLRNAAEPIMFEGEKEFRPELLKKVEKGYEFLDKFLTSKWLVGDEMTLADISCVATVSTTNVVLPIDENAYPRLKAWLELMESQDFYKKANVPGLNDMIALVKSKTGQ